MAERLADVSARIGTMRQLDGVFTAMRGIAASRAQQARALVAGADAHAAIAARAIAEALALLPQSGTETDRSSGTRRLMILFCAEQGFAGAYSAHVLEAAALQPDDLVFLVGTRGQLAAEQRGLVPDRSLTMVTRAAGATGLANSLADGLYEAVDRKGVAEALMVFPTAESGTVRVETEALMPFDPARFGLENGLSEPLTTLAPELLLERLVAEYVFARLCRAALRALEAENQARIAALSSARSNVGTKLDELVREQRRLRQEEITSELIEVTAGAVRLQDKGPI